MEDVGASYPRRVTLHPTCHSQRVTRIGDAPQRLLAHVRGLELLELPEAAECCGFGGTFSIKNADVSLAMLEDKCANILATGAEVVTAVDPSCLLHIGGGLSRLARRRPRAVHLREHPGGTAGGRTRGEPRPHDFPAAAREALADEQLRTNLRRATQTIRARRAAAVAELPDWEELREQARRVKDDALGRLDELLDEFQAAAEAAGAHVHRAADAAAANAVVAGIARGHGVTELVKMKSLATDEIGLDAALAAAGVEAVETDLAELIVQLAGDTASHILVPAVHYSRGQVRDLFRRTIAHGQGPLRRPARARRGLAPLPARAVPARAGMGVTGANVGVAETGTVCVVENEGNGRMVTTLPPVLVTVMGIEKVVPYPGGPRPAAAPAAALRDRRADELLRVVADRGDARRRPREYHIVLLDNGRRNALADPVGRQALRCIRCSACLNVCPVYTRVGGHAYGSIYPGPDRRDPDAAAWGMEEHAKLPFASSLCGACAEVCPVGIDIPEVLLHLRARAVREQAPAPEKAAFGAAAWAFGSPRRFAAAQKLGRAAELPLVRGGLVRRLPAPLAGWTQGRDLRPVARETFREWWARERGADRRTTRRASAGRRRRERCRVDLFVGAPARPAARRGPPRGRRAASRRRSPRSAPSAACAGSASRRGCRPEWRPAGVDVVEDHELAPAELDALDAALTGCTLAIAETGSLVLAAGSADGRRALSLVPDVYLCVVVEDQVEPDLAAAMPRIAGLIREEGRPVVFVSGPSATSDIELQRVEGVHGPRQLVVLLVS